MYSDGGCGGNVDADSAGVGDVRVLSSFASSWIPSSALFEFCDAYRGHRLGDLGGVESWSGCDHHRARARGQVI